ncbi:hypothetical protein COU58_02795 [Candidatus Pacearchaeota archaeon CG10_big_fil_rev_8_21_14_0_10_32_42]|nr:MAG: hypothetical protein COU58_02795 [Candidatus Pacearchaeota archaeon CG10_big_fil_rev_8_21_14_0_10_32_42]
MFFFDLNIQNITFSRSFYLNIFLFLDDKKVIFPSFSPISCTNLFPKKQLFKQTTGCLNQKNSRSNTLKRL